MSRGALPQAKDEELLGSDTVPATTKRVRSFARAYAGALVLILVLLIGWELTVRLGNVPEYLLPAPSQIVADLRTDWVVLGPALGHLG